MTRKTGIIPKAPVARILFKAGADRVSADAVDAFVEVITQIAEEIGTHAVSIAKHSGRKTVQEADIRLAAK
ncbi:MAG: histone family protein [Candidatus Woesearchaeota archaeon]